MKELSFRWISSRPKCDDQSKVKITKTIKMWEMKRTEHAKYTRIYRQTVWRNVRRRWLTKSHEIEFRVFFFFRFIFAKTFISRFSTFFFLQIFSNETQYHRDEIQKSCIEWLFVGLFFRLPDLVALISPNVIKANRVIFIRHLFETEKKKWNSIRSPVGDSAIKWVHRKGKRWHENIWNTEKKEISI